MSILRDDYDDTLKDWLEQHVDSGRLDAWGIPDTSANPLADMCRQLTTPGLYGVRPTFRHRNDNAGLIGNDGLLDGARYFTLMQFVQFMTIGMGDFMVRLGASDTGKLTARPVAPQNVWVRVDPNEPTKALELWELRLLWDHTGERWVWAWEQFILDGDAPAYRISEALPEGGAGADISNIFLKRPDGTFGALEGVNYPWVRADGTPRIPFVVYHAVDTGEFWNQFDKRGAHRGTLNAALYSTYAGHCARDATGSMVVISGLVPARSDMREGSLGVSGGRADGALASTLMITPGSLLYHTVMPDQTPFVHEIKPGVNLPDVDSFARNYEMRVAMRFGLNPADAQRTAANPASGISLFISRDGKRQYSRQVEPCFRASDLDAIELAAIIMRAVGTGNYDESGYSVTYAEIPNSPQEEKERRENLAWKVSEGLISRVAEFQTLNPGTTEEDARQALVSNAVSNAMLEAEVKAQLSVLGLGDSSDLGNDMSVDSSAQAAPEPDKEVMTLNERRAADGLEPLPDGNAIFMPSNLIAAVETA